MDKVASCLQQMRDATGMSYGIITYDEGHDVTPLIVHVLRRWLGRSGLYFYFSGHGYATLPSGDRPVQFGPGRKISFQLGTSDSVTTYVREFVKRKQYKFVFMDACATAGYDLSGPISHMSANPDTQWAAAFNVNLSDGGFIGWNGYCLLSLTNGPWVGITSFGHWRDYFWDGLTAGKTIIESCTHADLRTQPSLYSPYYPYSSEQGRTKRL